MENRKTQWHPRELQSVLRYGSHFPLLSLADSEVSYCNLFAYGGQFSVGCVCSEDETFGCPHTHLVLHVLRVILNGNSQNTMLSTRLAAGCVRRNTFTTTLCGT